MFNVHMDWYNVLIVVATISLTVFVSFRRWSATPRRDWMFFLSELSRILAISMICLSLLKFELVSKTTRTLKPEIVLLRDVSDSMKTIDVLDKSSNSQKNAMSRTEWVDAKLAAKFYKKLEPRFKIEERSFSMPPGNDGKTATDGTDLSYALSDVSKSSGNTRAVILLSDGDWNTGGSPVGAASELRAKNVNVFAVGTGSQTWLPDLELIKVKTPAFCLSNEKMAIPFLVKNRLNHSVTARLALESNAGPTIYKKIEIPAGGSLQDTILWQPGNERSYQLNMKVPIQNDELVLDNNSSSFKIDVRNEKLKVLVIDSNPRWEYRYLRNALMRDPGVDVKTLLYLPNVGMGGGKGYLKKFPDKKSLSTFDVIFLGDVGLGKGELTKKQADMMAEMVEQQGSGLIFLPGRRGRLYSLMKTKLGPLSPVVLDPENPEGYSSGVESQMALTGIGRSHFLMMLADTPSMNDYVWRHLPGFFWNARVLDAKPGSDVLAVHSGLKGSSGRMPLIVIAERGNGNVLFMGTDSAWRWRKGVEDKYHYRFWGQVVRWMAHKRHLADDEGIRCFYVPESPTVNKKVTLFATVHDRSGGAIDGVTVTSTITPPTGGIPQTINLHQEKSGWGLYKGEFTPTTPGTTSVNLKCRDANADMTFKIEVTGENRERVGSPANFASLREITGITGGGFYDTNSLDKLVETIKGLPKRLPEIRVTRIWCGWWWGAAIILLLTIHWGIRKLRGEL